MVFGNASLIHDLFEIDLIHSLSCCMDQIAGQFALVAKEETELFGNRKYKLPIRNILEIIFRHVNQDQSRTFLVT